VFTIWGGRVLVIGREKINIWYSLCSTSTSTIAQCTCITWKTNSASCQKEPVWCVCNMQNLPLSCRWCRSCPSHAFSGGAEPSGMNKSTWRIIVPDSSIPNSGTPEKLFIFHNGIRPLVHNGIHQIYSNLLHSQHQYDSAISVFCGVKFILRHAQTAFFENWYSIGYIYIPLNWNANSGYPQSWTTQMAPLMAIVK